MPPWTSTPATPRPCIRRCATRRAPRPSIAWSVRPPRPTTPTPPPYAPTPSAWPASSAHGPPEPRGEAVSTYPPAPGTLRPPCDPPPAGDITQRPNPEYAELYDAYQRAFESAQTLEKALDPPVRTAGEAWVGPAARSWQNDLET